MAGTHLAFLLAYTTRCLTSSIFRSIYRIATTVITPVTSTTATLTPVALASLPTLAGRKHRTRIWAVSTASIPVQYN